MNEHILTLLSSFSLLFFFFVLLDQLCDLKTFYRIPDINALEALLTGNSSELVRRKAKTLNFYRTTEC